MGDQCFQAQEVLRENGPCISAGCWFSGVQGRLHHAIHVHEDHEYRRAWEFTGVEVGAVLGLVLTDTEEHLYLQIGGTIQLTHIH